MRLTKGQRQLVLQWIAEGLRTDEINGRAAEQKKPFSVTRQQVDHYRKTRSVDLKTIEEIGQKEALTEGYATREERVKKLSILAALIERDIFGGFLWLEMQKGVAGVAVDFEEFNKGEVDAYRGVLDDIAKETGGRVQKQEIGGKDGGPVILRVVYGSKPGRTDDPPA